MKKHVRVGRYTKKPSKIQRIKRWFGDTWQKWRAVAWWKKILIIGVPPLTALLIFAVGTYMYFANDISDRERLMNRNNTGIVITDINDQILYSSGNAEKRAYIELKDIPKHLKEALLASEDKDFYEHGGFNVLSIGRALLTNISAGSINAYGGSTLTQQLAKNTLLTDQKSFVRKYQELAVSVAIEQQYTKDDILAMYFNSVYYGENAFGIEEAARVYFGKKPSDLSLAESAMLVGVLPAPSAYSPISGDETLAKQRQKTVLERMVRNEYITQQQADAAAQEALAYQESAGVDAKAPHFVQMVLNRVNRDYSKDGNNIAQRAGYRVKTTLNLGMQEKLEAAVAGNRSFIQANGGSNASAVAIDPKTGEIRALVGSADWNNEKWGKVNMVTTPRQPGSSFKTIYYAGALAEGVITPATVYADEATDFGGYTPQNADRRFRGAITVRNAINQSLNIPSVKVMRDYGISKSIETSKRMGIEVDENREFGLAYALGVSEAPLLQMTNAYAALAHSGQQYTNSSIHSITDRFDRVIYTNNQEAKAVIDASGAYLISDILSDNAARSKIFGSSLTLNGRKAAVKTGTTEEARDAWTIGYTPSLAVGVWVGNNDNTPMNNGGSRMAGPIWRNAMNTILAGTAAEEFSRPATVVQRATCYSNYGLATNSIEDGTFKEYYLATALPQKTCTPVKPEPIEVCDIDKKEVKKIEEKEFDEKKHSKDLDDCKKEVKKITYCNLNTGERIEVAEDESVLAVYTTTLSECPPDPSLETETPADEDSDADDVPANDTPPSSSDENEGAADAGDTSSSTDVPSSE